MVSHKKEYFQYMTEQGTNDWVCQLCFRTFVNAKGCTRHELSVHKMGKKYECKVCKKCLVGKYNFDIHMASHKNVPGVCDLCGLELAEKRYLKKHHQKVHASEEEKNCCAYMHVKHVQKHFMVRLPLPPMNICIQAATTLYAVNATAHLKRIMV